MLSPEWSKQGKSGFAEDDDEADNDDDDVEDDEGATDVDVDVDTQNYYHPSPYETAGLKR